MVRLDVRANGNILKRRRWCGSDCESVLAANVTAGITARFSGCRVRASQDPVSHFVPNRVTGLWLTSELALAALESDEKPVSLIHSKKVVAVHSTSNTAPMLQDHYS